MRVEFSRGIRSNQPRLVLMVEIPAEVMQKIRAERVSPQGRAYEVAMSATEEQRTHGRDLGLSLLSNTPAKVKDPAGLGSPSFVADDGCRAWIVKKPKSPADH